MHYNQIFMEKIILFYRYTQLANPETIRQWQLGLCRQLSLNGRIILAYEGINGTLGGQATAIARYIHEMQQRPEFAHIDFKESPGSASHFPTLKIQIRPEIVHLGRNKIHATDGGVHLTPAEAHQLINNNPKLVLLDSRNYYEARIGTFTNAITPPINYFREFPQFIDDNTNIFKDKDVLMFCTGGIRCEKASAYLKSKHVAKNIYQITGGIHRYIEQFPDGHFRGKNYVFDARIGMPANQDVIGSCDICKRPWDEYSNCCNASCNKQTLLCPPCKTAYDACCSQSCQELISAGAVKKRPLGFRKQHQKCDQTMDAPCQ